MENSKFNANLILLQNGIQKTQSQTFYYGEEDPSFKFAGLVNLVGNPAVSLITVPKADHNFYGMLEEFEELPKYLVGERG